MSGADELVEVIDADGTVVGIVTRAEMRARRLRHRSVAVVVRRPDDDAVLAHRRASWKDVWPSYWDLTFGGVCGVEETWVDAAVRELAEEAGIHVSPGVLVEVGHGDFTDDDVDEVATVFELRHDGPFTFPDGEVEEVAWVALDELPRWASTRDVCPDTLALARTSWLRADETT